MTRNVLATPNGLLISSSSQTTTKTKATWDPRWAEVDTESGFLEFTRIDETGATVPGTSSFCIGNLDNGAIYYMNVDTDGNTSTMYRRRLTGGNIGPAEQIWSLTGVVSVISTRINAENGAAVFFLTDGTQRRAIIMPSIDEYTDKATTIDLTGLPAGGPSSSALFSHANHWINDSILIRDKIYDSNGYVRTLPDNFLVAPSDVVSWNGNSEDGYFLVRFNVNLVDLFHFHEYNWSNNTVSTAIFPPFNRSSTPIWSLRR